MEHPKIAVFPVEIYYEEATSLSSLLEALRSVGKAFHRH